MAKKRKHLWSYSAGEKGWTILAYERTRGGVLQLRTPDPRYPDGYKRDSLGHRDQARAKAQVLEQAAKLQRGETDETQPRKLALFQLFARYEREVSPLKSKGAQVEDRRRIDMFLRQLGKHRDPGKLTKSDLRRFVKGRREGSIGPHGELVASDVRRPVGKRSTEADVSWLRWVLNWAVDEDLIPANPIHGFRVEKEAFPRRPIASTDRYENTRAHSDNVMMEQRWTGKRITVRSYVSELLDIVHETGRRISAICALRFSDLSLEQTATAPHGLIHFAGESDKEQHDMWVPLTLIGRRAVERIMRERPGIGDAYLFPSPKSKAKPITRHLAHSWLVRAEELAKLPKLKGGAWHPYRRMWATARKHLPLTDVAAAGGWASPETLQRCYLKADAQGVLNVMLNPAELREQKA